MDDYPIRDRLRRKLYTLADSKTTTPYPNFHQLKYQHDFVTRLWKWFDSCEEMQLETETKFIPIIIFFLV